MGLSNTLVWWEIAIALGVFLLFLYWDMQSRSKRLRWVRILALLLIIFSLIGLYTAPYQSSPSKQASLAWVTNNADNATLDSLTKAGFTVIENSSMYQYIRSEKGVEQLVVIGDGLEEWELNKVNSIDAFYPSKEKQEGVMDYFMGHAVEQSAFEVFLQLHLDSSISLALAGSGIETVTVATEQQKVTLEVVPTITGYLTYQLDGIRDQDTIFSEIIPVLVHEKLQTNVLMLSNSPSFEFRGLKNYLAEAGFGIAERLQVSTDLYHEAFTNISERRLSTISNRLLDDFQLLVINAATYDDLSNAEQQRIKAKVEQGALGMVFMGNRGANGLVSWQSKQQEVLTFNGANGEVKLTGAEWKMTRSTELPFKTNVVAQVKAVGLGQLVRPLFTDSYALKLQAEHQLYARLWQQVLEGVVGNIEIPTSVQTADFPRVHEQARIQIMQDDIEELRIAGVRLAPTQQWFAPHTWNATYWPQQRGWQMVTVDNEEKGQFFAFDSTDWTLQKRHKKQQQTAAFVSQKVTSDQRAQATKTPISKWIFFGLFLAAISFLWVEQRVG